VAEVAQLLRSQAKASPDSGEHGGIARAVPAMTSLALRPFSSVRARLIVAFATVAGLALLLAGGAVALVVRDYRTRIAVDHLSDLAIISTFTARQLEEQQAGPEAIAIILAGQVRGEADAVLIVDPTGRVVADRRRTDDENGDDATEESDRLVGKLIAIPANAASAPAPAMFDFTVLGRRIQLRPFAIGAADRGWGLVGARARLGNSGPPVIVWEASAGLESPVVMVTTDVSGIPSLDADSGRGEMARADNGRGETSFAGPNRTDRSARPPLARGSGRPGGVTGSEMARQLATGRYRVVLATPARDLQSAWRDLAPRLTIAGSIALAISLAAAITMAGSISSGIGRISVAAKRIAGGDLNARVPVSGHDEIAALGRTFNDMADEVHRSQASLRNFVADASHELRTPLTSIQGFSAALLDGALSGEEGAMRAGAIISEEASRMRALVEDLLYLSKVEAVRGELRRDPVALDSIAHEAVRRLGHLAEAREQVVHAATSPVAEFIGDPSQIDLLVTNLIENAIKHAPDAARIGIEVGTQRANGVDATFLRVHNTGSTIPPEDLPHIFERFYRVDKSRSQQTEGSGLGLAIAREVARRHSGDIDVTSSEAGGTTFTVYFPTRVG
jgi:signal transduction histidine kinase